METIANLALPCVLCIAAVLLLKSKGTLFDSFLVGAREGVSATLSLLPTLIALLVGIGMYRASGVSDWVSARLEPLFSYVGLPSELSALLLLRPLSGGASTALTADLFSRYGADSLVGRCASVLLGSSDTVFYIVTVYFGAVGIKKGRHTLVAALVTMLFCTFLSCALVRFFFGA